MKKVLKIIAFVLLIALAVGCCVLALQRIVLSVNYLETIRELFTTTEGYRAELKIQIRNLIFDIFPYFSIFLLILINLFVIFFDSLFQEAILNFKSNYAVSRKKSREKKYNKLKSKIEKLESDE